MVNTREQLMAQVEILQKLAQDLNQNIQQLGASQQEVGNGQEVATQQPQQPNKIDRRKISGKKRLKEIHEKARAFDRAVQEGKISAL